MNFTYLNKYEMTDGPVVIALPSHLNQLDNFEEVDALLGGSLEAMVKEKVLSTKRGSISSTGATIQTEYKKVITVGLGNKNELGYKEMISVFAHLFKHLRKEKIDTAQVLLDSFSYDNGNLGEVLPVALYMAVHEFDSYKSDKKPYYIDQLNLTLTSAQDLESDIEKYKYLGEGIALARDYSETPPNLLYPENFAEQINAQFRDVANVTVEVKDDKTLEDEGYGLIMAVGKASVRKPRLVTLEYKPQNAKNESPVALVGKGITYDTGGYSIKTKNGMPEMKRDMSGAANVVGMFHAISKMELPVHVVAVLALAENMIDGNGMRPDDVYTALSGHSVEVKNTDAEGRLVLADAVFHAAQYSPEVIMDFATLTGAVVMALSGDRTGVWTNQPRAFIDDVLEVSDTVGEEMWQLPISEIEEEKVKKSEIADITNHYPAAGSASFAACFIKQFVDGKPWVHFDIAGSASTRTGSELGPKGATGTPIRTIVKYLEQYKS